MKEVSQSSARGKNIEKASSQSFNIHKQFLYFFTVISLIVTCLAAILGTLNGANIGNLFENTVGNISDKYFTQVTPSTFVFGTIWPIIFVWTITGSIYLVISLYLPLKQSPVKMVPEMTPLAYFILNVITFIFINSWYFAFDAENITWTFLLLIFSVLLTYAAIGITLKRTYDNLISLENNSKVTLWLVRILVQNGQCVFATWITLATMLSFTIILVYVDSPGLPVATLRGVTTEEAASSIAFNIILCLIVAWFIVENFVFAKYLRYIFTVYPVVIFAFIGVVVKLQDVGTNQNLFIASINLLLAVFLFLARIGFLIYNFHYCEASVGPFSQQNAAKSEC